MLLVGGSVARLVAIVTAFTIAHSITLVSAVLGLVALPAVLVEIAIAASIVYVAAQNILGRGEGHRARVTFAFGLIHGFGFAAVLREAGLPADTLLPALLAFNLGVEAGQLAVAVVVVPLLRLAARAVPQRRLHATLSWPILLAGLAWLWQRLPALY